MDNNHDHHNHNHHPDDHNHPNDPNPSYSAIDNTVREMLLSSTLLTDEELHWALNIKEAVEANSDLINLTDYEYAQFAMVLKDDLEEALHRIQGLQYFKQEYKIHDTIEEGMAILKAFHQQQPFLVLDLSHLPLRTITNGQDTTTASLQNAAAEAAAEQEEDEDDATRPQGAAQQAPPQPENPAHPLLLADNQQQQQLPQQNNTNTRLEGGHFVLIYDYGACNPKAIDTPEDWRVYLGGIYYQNKLTHVNPCSIRQGATHVCETLGSGWQNFSLEMFRKVWYHCTYCIAYYILSVLLYCMFVGLVLGVFFWEYFLGKEILSLLHSLTHSIYSTFFPLLFPRIK